MPHQRRTHGPSSAHITDLVSTALRQEKLGGLCEMLRSIAQSCEADACLLWRLAPGSDLTAQPPEGRLFVLAQWLKEDTLWASHNLSLNSVTGRGVITGEPFCITDVHDHPWVDSTDYFLDRTGAGTFCTVPVNFLDDQTGAVNVYRNMSQPFRDYEISRVKGLATLVPALYQTIVDKVSSALMRSVNDIIQAAERNAMDCPATKESMKGVVQAICGLVGDTFKCLEASIFFEDHIALPGAYELVATTWQRRFPKTTYTKNDAALTSWILAHARPVRLFNLNDFHNERELTKIRREYDGLTWTDSLEFREHVRDTFGPVEDGQQPPLSFMGAPIMVGNAVLGVIRCFTAIRPPHYFADGDLRLLELVASQIGQYWGHWVTRRETEEENRSWRTFVSRVSEMNHLVQKDLAGGELNEGRIYNGALEVAESVIRGADILDIRLLDEDKQELYYAATKGDAWGAGDPRECAERRAIRYPISDDPPRSIGAQVVRTGTSYVASDLHGDPKFHHRFSGTKRFIGAPVQSQDKVIGVLDIRGVGPADFPKHTVSIAELLGQQLGLYHYLARSIRELRLAKDELRNQVRNQTETYQDLGHQLKSPIFLAQARIQSLLRSVPPGDNITGDLYAIRGLVAKAKRVAMNIRLFAQLSSQQVEVSQLTPLRHDDLIKTLIEYARDHRQLLGDERDVGFTLDQRGFDVLRRHVVRVDYDLLEQAVNNVLENAFKYSFAKTTVRIGAGMTGTRRFHITVINEGLRLRAGETAQCKERGWRSEDAQATSGEGSGLGLWIVEYIMRAHNGELLILPTTTANLTEVKLLFPVAS